MRHTALALWLLYLNETPSSVSSEPIGKSGTCQASYTATENGTKGNQMRASQTIQFIGLAGLLIASVSNAGPVGYDPSLSKEKRLEASAPCTDGSCYHFDQDSGLSGVEAQVHKINIFDKNGKDPRVHQSYEGEGKKFASIGRVRVNQAVPWMNDSGKLEMVSDVVGSGFMISPCLFLTNYHVVFGKSRSPNSSDFSVTFSSIKSATGKPIAWGPKDKTGEMKDDWAIVQLDPKNCIGVETGWMVPSDLSPSELKQKSLTIAGLPVDKSTADLRDPLYVSKGVKIKSEGSGRLKGTYLVDGAGRPGTSGGPLYYEDENGIPTFAGVYAGSVKHSDKILKSYDARFANVAIDALGILGNGENFGLIMADVRRNGNPRNRIASR